MTIAVDISLITGRPLTEQQLGMIVCGDTAAAAARTYAHRWANPVDDYEVAKAGIDALVALHKLLPYFNETMLADAIGDLISEDDIHDREGLYAYAAKASR